MSNNSIFIIGLVTLLFSCENSNLKIGQLVHGGQLSPSSGLVVISDNKRFGSGAFGVTSINADFTNLNSDDGAPGILKVNDLVVEPTVPKKYATSKEQLKVIKGMYGKSVAISLKKKDAADTFETSLDLPERLFISHPSECNDTISRTETVTWERDPNYDQSIYLFIQFKTEDSRNGRFQEAKSSSRLIHVEDTGSYQFQQRDFDRIPSGAYITIEIGRGTWEYVPQEGIDPIGVLGYTQAFCGLYLK